MVVNYRSRSLFTSRHIHWLISTIRREYLSVPCSTRHIFSDSIHSPTTKSQASLLVLSSWNSIFQIWGWCCSKMIIYRWALIAQCDHHSKYKLQFSVFIVPAPGAAYWMKYKCFDIFNKQCKLIYVRYYVPPPPPPPLPYLDWCREWTRHCRHLTPGAPQWGRLEISGANDKLTGDYASVPAPLTCHLKVFTNYQNTSQQLDLDEPLVLCCNKWKVSRCQSNIRLQAQTYLYLTQNADEAEAGSWAGGRLSYLWLHF